jgi:hypothetical protein
LIQPPAGKTNFPKLIMAASVGSRSHDPTLTTDIPGGPGRG